MIYAMYHCYRELSDVVRTQMPKPRKREKTTGNKHFCQMITPYLKREKEINLPKKMNCPAQFSVKKLLYFPGYEVSKSSSQWKQDKKKKSLKHKLMSLKNSSIPSEEEDVGVDYVVSRKKRKVGVDEKVAAVLNYVTIFSPMSDHQFHHQGQAAGLIEPLDERVREYIKKLVRVGVRRKADILSRTKKYVNEEIFQGLLNPDCNIIACVRYET